MQGASPSQQKDYIPSMKVPSVAQTHESVMNQSSKVTFFTMPMREMSLRVTKMLEATSNAIVIARTTGPLSWTPSPARLDDMGPGSVC